MNPMVDVARNTDAERSVLGAFLQDEKTHAMLNELAPEDFFHPAHKEIYESIRDVIADGRTPDLVTVDEKLASRGTLEGIGGTEYLVQLIQYVPTTANTRSYVEIVLDYSNRRKVLELGKELQTRIMSGEGNLAEIVLDASNALRGIRVTGGKFVHIGDALVRMYDETTNIVQHPERKIKTGIRSIDLLFKGFRNSRLTVLGAPTSAGKSAFAMSIATHIARDGWNVAYFSLEMASTELAQRMVASVTALNTMDIDDGKLNEDQIVKMAEAMGPLSTLGIRFVEDAFTIEEIFARAQWMAEQGYVDFLVIDHLHLISTAKRFHSDTETTKYVSQQIKHLSMTINKPVLAVAQLSRSFTTRLDKRPVLSDFRGTSSLEQDANNALVIHPYQDAEEPGMDEYEKVVFENVKARGGRVICVRCLKQRGGGTFDTNIVFYPAYMRFEDIERKRT